MSHDPTLQCSEDECHALFGRLFPGGFGGDDVMQELAPEGWEHSPLSRIAHPTVEQLYDESTRMHANIASLSAERADAPEPSAPPTLDEICAEHNDSPYEPERELRELVGMCLWDIFSDNHEVTGPDGRVFNLGSFRASGGFLAEVVNLSLGVEPGAAEAREMERLQRMIGLDKSNLMDFLTQMAEERSQADRIYDYMDFYLGTQSVSSRADLSPVYRMIFNRLHAENCDWVYHFPKLLLVDMRPLHDAMKEQDAESPEWEEYNPSAAFEQAESDRQRDEELANMRAEMEEAHREAVDAAQQSEPPKTVQAYHAVYGEYPEGWPPRVDD
jgi:hypothetical protein